MQDFSRLQPGWCGSGHEQRPEKWHAEVKSSKLLPLGELAARWEDEVITRYNGRPKDVLSGATPTEAWLAGLSGPPTAIEPALLDFALLKRAKVKVNNWGFWLHGLRFELAIGSSPENADLLVQLLGRYVDVHYDFALTTIRLYHEGEYVCDGRPLRLASFLDQSSEVNEHGLKLAANQRQVLRARREELHRAPLSQPDAYLTAVSRPALPEPEAVRAEVIPLLPPQAEEADPSETPRPNFTGPRERYDWCWRRLQAGQTIPDYDAAWMPDFEQGEFFQTYMADYYRGLGELLGPRRQTG